MRKTKIICTLGPSTDNDDTMRELILEGMDVARFNFSHGDHKEHKGRLDRLTRLREELKIPVATLLDTKGPEIRIGTFKDKLKPNLKQGQTFILTSRDVEGDENIVSIDYPSLVDDIEIGTIILIDDGLVEMVVTEIKDKDIVCEVKMEVSYQIRRGSMFQKLFFLCLLLVIGIGQILNLLSNIIMIL